MGLIRTGAWKAGTVVAALALVTAVAAVLLAMMPARALAGENAGAGAKWLAEIKEDSAPDLKLDWTMQTYVKGEYLFVSSHRNCRISTFKRDVKTGLVQFLGFYDLGAQLKNPKPHCDIYPVLTDKNILYLAGEWTHPHGNDDSLGLTWLKFDPKDGSLKLLGHIPTDAGSLLEAPDKKSLVLTAWYSGAIEQINLAADGTPTVGAKITGKGLVNRSSNGAHAAIAPDGKFLYSSTELDAGWVAIKPDGSLAYGGSCSLEKLEPPAGLAGNVRAHTVAVSPDGKNVYVFLWSYKFTGVALLNRDPKTGALTFGEKLAVDGMGGANHVVFSADGKTGYFSAGPESPGAGVGFFQRDPATGKLTLGSKVPKSPASDCLSWCADSGALYVAGNWGTHSFWIFGTKE